MANKVLKAGDSSKAENIIKNIDATKDRFGYLKYFGREKGK
ncbi:MAG: hypothetical protein Q8O87_02580 [bacterium]|nr:hypothetical protein [bacterium]